MSFDQPISAMLEEISAGVDLPDPSSVKLSL